MEQCLNSLKRIIDIFLYKYICGTKSPVKWHEVSWHEIVVARSRPNSSSTHYRKNFEYFFFSMHTCKRNPSDPCNPKTVNKYFNGPYFGYFSSELDENFNISSIYGYI